MRKYVFLSVFVLAAAILFSQSKYLLETSKIVSEISELAVMDNSQ